MITPSFGLTATERVLPKLALDFTTASLDSRITFTRALNTATRVNSSGYVETVNADTPRFDYSPITLACKGLLIEETRSNLLAYSEDYSQSVWSLSTGMTIDASYQSPSNSMTANRIKERTTASATNSVLYTTGPTITANSTITLSAFIKAVPGEAQRYVRMTVSSDAAANGFRAMFNPNTGSNSLAGAAFGTGTFTSATTESYGNGWYRVSITGKVDPAATTLTQVGIYLQNQTTSYGASYTGNGTAGVILWGAQLEAGAFATSYIPTTTTALTRNADVATMTGTNFSDWFNQSAGTFVTSFFAPQADGGAPISGSSGSYWYLYRQNSTLLRSYDGTNSLNTTVATMTPTTQLKVASSYSSTGRSQASGGGSVTSVATTYGAAGSSLLIGSRASGANYLNNCVSKIFYYPQRLTDAEVQAFSK